MGAVASKQLFRFAVRLTPKGGRDAIEGWREDASGKRVLAARVSAPPADGKANEALVALLARRCDIAKSKVKIVAGASSRVKIVEVEGEERLFAPLLAGKS